MGAEVRGLARATAATPAPWVGRTPPSLPGRAVSTTTAAHLIARSDRDGAPARLPSSC